MKQIVIALMLMLLGACSASPPPTLGSSPGPDDPAAPTSNTPYRPVMAGTAYHGLGRAP